MRIPYASLPLLTALVLAGGCQSSDYDNNSYDFDPHKSRTRAILDAQYAKGAAEDAALTPHHFEGLALNGLGRDKLDWILRYGRRNAPLVIHVDLPGASAEQAEPMLQAVRDYLKVSGVAVTDQTVALGASPVTTSASGAVAGLKRLDQRQAPASGAAATPGNALASQESGLFSGE